MLKDKEEENQDSPSSNYLTRTLSSPTSDPAKPVLFGYVCLSGPVQKMDWTNSVSNSVHSWVSSYLAEVSLPDLECP